jgi:predicted nucleic acid-binding protein
MPINAYNSVLLDTNILLRLVTAASPLHAVTAEALRRLLTNNITLYICPQNMHEFRQVATRPSTANGFGWTSPQTVNAMLRIEADFVLLPETPSIYPAWKHITETVEATGRANFDARLVAVAEVNRIDAVLTFEAAAFARYGAVASVSILDPLTVK